MCQEIRAKLFKRSLLDLLDGPLGLGPDGLVMVLRRPRTIGLARSRELGEGAGSSLGPLGAEDTLKTSEKN